jgi:hypothetical protein
MTKFEKSRTDPVQANPIRWGKRHISTLDKLAKVTTKYAGPKLLNSSHKTTAVLIALGKKAGRKGVTLARKHKGVGIVLASWMILANGPKAAAADFFQITPAGVDAMMEGQLTISMEIWDPDGSVDVAELRSGQVIREGDEYWYAWKSPENPSIVGIVDRGEIDYIVPTETPGVVNVFVRFGQEVREYTNIDSMREDINPVEGDLVPSGM